MEQRGGAEGDIRERGGHQHAAHLGTRVLHPQGQEPHHPERRAKVHGSGTLRGAKRVQLGGERLEVARVESAGHVREREHLARGVGHD
jgi:hypothetical protein